MNKITEVHNKLVRDKVPELIEQDGGKPDWCQLQDHLTYSIRLGQKLAEEMNKYCMSENIDEAAEGIADLIEVLRATAKLHKIPWSKIEQIRKDKLAIEGGYENRTFLWQASY